MIRSLLNANLFKKKFKYLILLILFSFEVYSDGYNNFGHVGLINLPSAAIKKINQYILLFQKALIQKLEPLLLLLLNGWKLVFFIIDHPIHCGVVRKDYI